MHEPTDCAFCGHSDATHRVRDTILSRFLAGESLDSLVLDYGRHADPVARAEEIEAQVRQAMRERLA